jgi:hypothetical protein
MSTRIHASNGLPTRLAALRAADHGLLQSLVLASLVLATLAVGVLAGIDLPL